MSLWLAWLALCKTELSCCVKLVASFGYWVYKKQNVSEHVSMIEEEQDMNIQITR